MGSETLYSGQLTLSTQFLKTNYLVIPLLTQHYSLFRNLAPLFILYAFTIICVAISEGLLSPIPRPVRQKRIMSNIYFTPLSPTSNKQTNQLLPRAFWSVFNHKVDAWNFNEPNICRSHRCIVLYLWFFMVV